MIQPLHELEGRRHYEQAGCTTDDHCLAHGDTVAGRIADLAFERPADGSTASDRDDGQRANRQRLRNVPAETERAVEGPETD